MEREAYKVRVQTGTSYITNGPLRRLRLLLATWSGPVGCISARWLTVGVVTAYGMTGTYDT